MELPLQFRCVSYTIGLVCTVDAANVMEDNFKNTFKSVFGKCVKLWKICGEPNISKKICEKLGRKLRIPCTTKWSSKYHSITVILECKTNINELTSELKLRSFTDSDFHFLEEYAIVMKPFATALVRMKGDEHTYFGEVLPTLLAIERKLQEIEDSSLVHCRGLLFQVRLWFSKRFENFLTLSMDSFCKMAIVASISNPQFKLKWLRIKTTFNNQEVKSKVERVFDEAMNRELVKQDDVLHETEMQPEDHDSFFHYDQQKFDEGKPPLAMNIELLTYLDDKSSCLQSLHKYPVVKKIFLRYNTPLSSSVPVEKLFGIADQVHASNRNSLSDEMFRTLMLVKANYIYNSVEN